MIVVSVCMESSTCLANGLDLEIENTCLCQWILKGSTNLLSLMLSLKINERERSLVISTWWFEGMGYGC